MVWGTSYTWLVSHKFLTSIAFISWQCLKYVFEFSILHLLIILFKLLRIVVTTAVAGCAITVKLVVFVYCMGEILLYFLLKFFVLGSEFWGVEYIIKISLKVFVRGVASGYYVSFPLIKDKLKLISNFDFDIHFEAFEKRIINAVHFLIPLIFGKCAKYLYFPLGIDIFRSLKIYCCYKYLLIK